MVIRKVDRNTFDVFLAEEFWGDWTRVRFGNRGIYYVSGRRLPNKLMQSIASTINED